MPKAYGTTRDGRVVDDAAVEKLADEAEAGYDVEALVRRRGGRPSLGSGPSAVTPVRLDPAVKTALLLSAAEQQVTLSEVIRRAIDAYLKAS